MAAPQCGFEKAEILDVLIIGAGISGINCAYRLQTDLPHVKFAILEGRDRIGGTWDLYRYPGVRSDSDIYSMGFAWHPWSFDQPIATGDQIVEYLSDAVSKNHLDRHIRFRHMVSSANWSTPDQNWTLVAKDHDGLYKYFRARWIILGTGYYDYDTPLHADIPGLDSFKGQIINPQFWPSDFNYNNQKIAVIGSGATAVSLLPALPERAAQVTMIQRSPTYIHPSPNTAWLQLYFPRFLVDLYRRIRYLITPYLMVLLCRYYPDLVKDSFRKEVTKLLPNPIDYDTHFKPRYNPWDQRICTDPDGTFYKTLHLPNVHLITGEIDTVTNSGIRMQDGQIVDVDTIITATGIKMLMGGKIDLKVDGEPVSWRRRYIWNGAMLDSVPNMMFMFGYTNHSWTLGSDDTAIVLTRLWRYMEGRAVKIAILRVPADAATGTQRLWQLNATYVLAADDELPVYGMSGNWKPRNRPPIDYVHARWGDFTSGLDFCA
ncbi:putative flavin-binding monooxygenase [Hypoxylon trugodes]|uniref:putative flavin-binding monooxygenase n=1 Tax=Hypoxylon trugodes TaxID=326681 RepID=UPI0021975447|nr:putative flavin-binding monooxygenase [Hypoxylon trugodes]KAI1393003.1 putative flavin-binding monooxygenase [Hypoxylon trugodes]